MAELFSLAYLESHFMLIKIIKSNDIEQRTAYKIPFMYSPVFAISSPSGMIPDIIKYYRENTKPRALAPSVSAPANSTSIADAFEANIPKLHPIKIDGMKASPFEFPPIAKITNATIIRTAPIPTK